jgi:hypothetical protein
MLKVNFEFNPGDYVKTDFGVKGRIELCAVFPGNRIEYSVTTNDDCNWYSEKYLTLWDEEE